MRPDLAVVTVVAVGLHGTQLEWQNRSYLELPDQLLPSGSREAVSVRKHTLKRNLQCFGSSILQLVFCVCSCCSSFNTDSHNASGLRDMFDIVAATSFGGLRRAKWGLQAKFLAAVVMYVREAQGPRCYSLSTVEGAQTYQHCPSHLGNLAIGIVRSHLTRQRPEQMQSPLISKVKKVQGTSPDRLKRHLPPPPNHNHHIKSRTWKCLGKRKMTCYPSKHLQ